MKTPAQLTHALVAGAVIASGLTVLVAVAGPVSGAAAAVTTQGKVISVEHSASVGAFLTDNGDVYTYGDNVAGGTGQGVTTGITETPVKLATFAPAGEKVVQISVAGTFPEGLGFALTDGGKVFSWGYDGRGGLGDDSALANQSTPVQVSATWGSDEPVRVVSVAGGGRVVTESGRVYAWGYNEWGQTGIDNGGGNIATPVEVAGLYRPMDKVVQIVGGTNSMMARTASGIVIAAGTKVRGQRGDTVTPPDSNTYSPELGAPSFTGLAGGESIVSIGSGTNYYFAVSSTGKVWAWGSGQSGRFGNGGTQDEPTPIQIPIAPTMLVAGDSVASVEMGGSANMSMLLTTKGRLYTVGLNNNGMLGNGTTVNSEAFGKIDGLPVNDPIVDGVLGLSNAIAVTRSGVVYTWGNSLVTNQGGIGTGTQTPNVVSSPVKLSEPTLAVPFTTGVDAAIAGTPQVGTTLTGSAGTYAPSDATIAYAWKVGADTVSTTSSYAPRLADAGKTLTLTTTGTKAGYTNSVSTTPGQTVATVQGFTGTLREGQVLTASDATGTLTWGLSAVSSCTSPVTATGTTFTLPDDSAGQYVQLTQTFGTRTGSGTCVGPVAAASAATISGAETASGVKGQSFSYTPTVAGAPVPTVTVTGTLPTGVSVDPSTGVLSGTPTVAGEFPVTLTADNGVGTPATLPLTITVDDVVTGLSPTISGKPKVGVKLTASAGSGLVPSGATVEYLWQYASTPGNWTDLSPGATYTPGVAEIGRAFRVKVSVSKAGYQSRTAYSAATAATAKGTFTIAAPSVTGTAKIGQTLQARVGSLPAGATLTWQWYSGSSRISGATSASYKLPASAHLQQVRAVATVRVAGYDEATASSPSLVVRAAQLTLALDRSSVVVGGRLQITVTNLLPGERWTLTLGNGRQVASGRAPAAGGGIVRTVRLPREAKAVRGKRYLKIETKSPNREAVVSFTQKRR